MLSGHLQGKFLEIISRMIKPENILEIGTYTGYSAICLAKGLKKNGKLDTIEINDELKIFINKYIAAAGLQDKITLYTGNALQIIPLLNKKYDLVFIDGDKKEYIDYYTTAFPFVKPGGFILADNVLWNGKVVGSPENKNKDTLGIMQFNDLVQQDQRAMNVMLPLRDGLMIIQKKHD